ncbi:MAG: hypothetical protein FJX77_05135 [Armatimonadetes bacterium]|nr:hypothetical protein [Armatimonadota bacterium]
MNSSDLPPSRRITTDGKLKFAPVYVGPDEIVYAAHELPNQVVLQRLRLTTGAIERLHPDVAEHQFDPAFSADGRYHCYIKSAGSPQLLLVIQDRRMGREARVVPREARAVARCPTVAPGGTQVAFHLSDGGGQQIAACGMDGAQIRRLTSAQGIYASPDFSPDGRRIAFASSRDGDFEIYTMDADGGAVRRLTRSPGLDLRPRWSPDGNRIAFTSNRDGNYEIYVMDADGGDPRRVTNHPERDDYAVWSPDGKSLLLVSERRGRSELYLQPLQ